MTTSIKYAAFVIFLLAIFALMWILRDGISVRNGRGGRPLNSMLPDATTRAPG